MKEEIYTIPINEALEQEGFCPFCYLKEKIEKDAVNYTLGPAMMEPEFRIFTNERGFCQRHMRELQAQRNALSLTLVLETHFDTVKAVMGNVLKSEKKSRFGKKVKDRKEVFAEELGRITASCAVRERIEHTFSGYINTFIFMLKREKDFVERVLATDGFCIEHFAQLAKAASEKMSDGEFEKYFIPIIEHQKSRLEKQHEDLKKFAESFDYRNAGKKLEVPRDTLIKSGYLLNGVFEPKE